MKEKNLRSERFDLENFTAQDPPRPPAERVLRPLLGPGLRSGGTGCVVFVAEDLGARSGQLMILGSWLSDIMSHWACCSSYSDKNTSTADINTSR